MDNCENCNAAKLKKLNDLVQYEYKGESHPINLSYLACNACGEEFVPYELIKENEKIIKELKRKLDNLYSSEDIKNIRMYFGLTQSQMASVFGGGVNAFSKYERGEVTVSEPMNKLLKLSVESLDARMHLFNWAVQEKKIDSNNIYNVVSKSELCFTNNWIDNDMNNVAEKNFLKSNAANNDSFNFNPVTQIECVT